MAHMSYKEIQKAIAVAKDRASVYQLLSQGGIEVNPNRSISTLIAKSLQDKDFGLNQILRAARDRLNELENLNA